MTIDPYAVCPGGCNKKIKFCCGKDISLHLDKIINSLGGEQRLAALDQTDATINQFGNKPCLLAIKTNILFQMDDWQKARDTLSIFLKEYPENSIALALDTVSQLQEHGLDNLDDAISQLQRCLENIEGGAGGAVLEAIRRVGVACFAAGRVLAARAHLTLYNGFLEEHDREISSLILRTMSAPEIPLLLKQDRPLVDCEEDFPWKEEFNQIISLTPAGRWLAAIEELSDLDKKYPNQPLIAKSIAILESRLGDPDEMAAAWSQYADTENVPLNDAIEAEALSQLVDPTIDADGIEVVDTTYAATSLEELTTKLAADKRFHLLDADLSQFADEGPPPKGAYLFLDKDVPESGEGITLEQVPNILGQILLFGKQTDQAPRISFIVARDDNFEASHQSLLKSIGDYLADEETSEEVIDEIPKVSHAMTWNWHLPSDTPVELRQQLVEEQRKKTLFEVWPDMPLDELDGKTPRQASKEDYYHIPLMGAILLLELSETPGLTDRLDCNPLRKDLGLPTRDPIDPTTLKSIQEVTLVQMDQVIFEKLDDDQLVAVFNVVGLCGATIPLRNACEEILKRESMASNEDVDFTQIYAILSRLEPDTEQALEYIHKARDITIDRGERVGRMLVAELELRLERGLVEQCGPILREIESRHIQEPGVSRELMEVLMRFGIIGPDGRPRGPMPDAASPETAAVGSGGIWTPDGPSGGASEEKKLWVPGD